MKRLRQLSVALFTASALTVAAFAADPSGKWKWTIQGRNGPTEVFAKIQLKGGARAGTISGRMGDTPIGDASFKDDQVAFTVTREVNGNKFVAKYDGRLAGDDITGTIERPGRGGDAPLTSEWKAIRVP